MVNIVKFAANTVPKWTKNGCRLLSKEKINFNFLPKNLIPKNAATLEKVEVETAFFGKLVQCLFIFR